MTSVFLSYDHDDAGKVRPIALALEKAGHSVWWDLHVRGGAQFSKVIEEALKAADAVVVLWSRRSVESAWVRDEAAAGRDSGRLVPVSLDETEPPLGFRQFQTIDLSGWKGRGKPKQLRTLLADIQEMATAKSADHATLVPPPSPASSKGRPRTSLVAIMAVLALVVALGVAWVLRPWAAGNLPVVAVRPADNSAAAQSLARDLLVTLGNAQSARTINAQVVDHNARKTPDLIIEVSGATSASRPSASLVLLRAADRQLLTSRDLTAADRRLDDLKTSLAMAAAMMMNCATEALPPAARMPLALVKTYVAGCANFGMLSGSDEVGILIPQFEQVLQREPNFLPARKRLLLAGAQMVAIATDLPKPSPEWLQAQIERARPLQGMMPELRLAELELLPANDFTARLKLVDTLHKDFPENPLVLSTRSQQLMLVGRLSDAVNDAERAAMLDPISPFSLSIHIRALAHSGRLPSAFQKLAEAAPDALGAKSLTEARFRLNMRYGDPQVALGILRRYGTSKQHEAFLLARTEPTRDSVERAIAISRTISAERRSYASHAEVLAAFGRNDELYRTLIGLSPHRFDQWLIATLFRPTLKDLRQDPQFLRIAKRVGLLDYWRTSRKWPDFCAEPDLPYDCDEEAAKIEAAAA